MDSVTPDQSEDWEKRISSHEYVRFRSIHSRLQLCDIWTYASGHPKYLSCCKSVARLISYTSRYNETCRTCTVYLTDTCLTDHIILDCPDLSSHRACFKRKISQVFGHRVTRSLFELDRTAYVNCMLGVACPTLVDILKDRYDVFCKEAFVFCHSLWLHYKGHID